MPKKANPNKARPTKDPHGRCGTTAGYSAHRRRGENTCRACKDAMARYASARNAAKPAKESAAKKVAPKPAKPTAIPRDAAPAVAPEARPVVDVVNTDADEYADLPKPPEYLRAKGKELWYAIVKPYDLTPAALIMLGEACRTTDRLERMAAALSSRSILWFELEESMDEKGLDGSEKWSVTVNGMIGEARQLQNTLKQTLTSLGVVGVEAANTGKEASVLDQLSARRAERLAKAEGGA